MTHMPRNISLFARKLRDWRTRNGAHGRLTQEGLAELLDVSVDAIGKYERSVSFIRGDLEYRLTDRLGWSREEVLACREDWEARQRHHGESRYQLMDEAAIDEHFGGSWPRAIKGMIAFAEEQFGDLPCDVEVNCDRYQELYESIPAQLAAVLCDGQFVAGWTLPFLIPEDEQMFRECRFVESTLSLERIRRPILPGTYFGYCPGLMIAPRHEAAAALLMSSFVRFLEDFSERDIFLHGVGTISVSPSGAQVCADLGMQRLGSHESHAEFGIWEISGAAIAQSIFAKRSPLLRHRYAEVFGA